LNSWRICVYIDEESCVQSKLKEKGDSVTETSQKVAAQDAGPADTHAKPREFIPKQGEVVCGDFAYSLHLTAVRRLADGSESQPEPVLLSLIPAEIRRELVHNLF